MARRTSLLALAFDVAYNSVASQWLGCQVPNVKLTYGLKVRDKRKTYGAVCTV